MDPLASRRAAILAMSHHANCFQLVTDLSGGLEGIQGVLGQSGLLDTVEQSGLTATIQGPLNSFVALVGNVVNVRFIPLANFYFCGCHYSLLQNIANPFMANSDGERDPGELA